MGVFWRWEYISFGGLFRIKVFLECRNAEGSVFGDGGVFFFARLSRITDFPECRNEGANSKSQALRIWRLIYILITNFIMVFGIL